MAMTTIIDAARTSLDAPRVEHTVGAYRDLHQGAESRAVAARTARAQAMVNQYYDLVTDFYEYGWGRSFHFAHRAAGEPMRDAILRHEHRLALCLGLQPGWRVLDVGCGVGGPLINIARLTGAELVGLNNNAYQLQRARTHTRAAGLEPRCSFVHGDFMQIPAADEQFDAAYAIEATCHAPDRTGVFAEVARVLQPGGRFAGYEWCLTDRYDPLDAEHRAIKRGIEEGDALPDITPTHAVDRALEAAGFEVLETRDLAAGCAPGLPWYHELQGGELTSLAGIGRTRAGRAVTRLAVDLLERVGVAPRGARQVYAVLNTAADSLVAAGRRGIFTPMYLFVARKK